HRDQVVTRSLVDFFRATTRCPGRLPMSRSTQWRREFAAPLHALQNELNRLFEEYWNPARVAAGQPPTDLEPAAWTPVLDVIETPQEVIIMAELPGVDPSSIDLSVTG